MRDYTRRAGEFVHRTGRTVRFYATLPLYVAFVFCLVVATVPILVLRYFATGEQ
jgi:hypothetical protein